MNRISFIIFLSCLLLASCAVSNQYNEPDIIIGDVSILPMTGNKELIANQYIEITNGKITRISGSRSTSAAEYIDGSGKYLMPGLTEMHAHIPTPKEGDDILVRETLFLYLSQGVTTIRGMLGDPYHLTLKNEVAKGTILSPRIYTSSPSMNGNSITNIEETRSKVMQYAEDGYDFLKIHPGIKIENWNELEKTAKKLSLPYAGHVPYEVGIQRAIDAKYATIDHLDGFIEGLLPNGSFTDAERGFFGYNLTDKVDRSKISTLVKRLKDNDIAIVPTQTLFTRWFSPEPPEEMMEAKEMQYMPSQTRFAWRQNKSRMISDSSYSVSKWKEFVEIRKEALREISKQGVTILLGSDAPQVMNVPGFSLHHEMKDLVQLGIPISEVLKSGTSKPAAFFNSQGSYGTVTVGASADLLLLTANPLEDINNVSKIDRVFVRGIQLTKRDIDTQLGLIALRNK